MSQSVDWFQTLTLTLGQLIGWSVNQLVGQSSQQGGQLVSWLVNQLVG
jgi:hypothetical protein